MKVKKGSSWVVGVSILTGLYVFTAYAAPNALPDIGNTIVLAIAFATVGYQAANVADNWQRSAHYHAELDESNYLDKEE